MWYKDLHTLCSFLYVHSPATTPDPLVCDLLILLLPDPWPSTQSLATATSPYIFYPWVTFLPTQSRWPVLCPLGRFSLTIVFQCSCCPFWACAHILSNPWTKVGLFPPTPWSQGIPLYKLDVSRGGATVHQWEMTWESGTPALQLAYAFQSCSHSFILGWIVTGPA